MHINIEQMTEDELRALNQRIIARLKILQQRNTINSMVKFQVGQRVSFDPDGRVRTGVLVKFNPKTVVVLTDEGQRWKVSPQFLCHLIDHEVSSNVTSLYHNDQGIPKAG
jgi:hypothetical protein